MVNHIHIGTSGWHYKHWSGIFYPPELPKKDYLKYYMNRFSAVEINNTFYQLPGPDTFIHWRDAVSDDFIFAVKVSRYITHFKKLNTVSDSLDKFLGASVLLKHKLGPFLFQLPPGWKCDAHRLEEFLSGLPRHNRYVFEFRDRDWFNDQINNLLRKYNCAFCVYDLNRQLSPIEATTDFVYIRLHGPEGPYQGLYDERALERWAEKIKTWHQHNLDVFCFFDNDQSGYAVKNAETLKQLLTQGG
jgi:uncharacterized protein YecE (DUF72 family)